MRQDPDWYEHPRRVGNTIYVVKVPFDPRGLAEAKTLEEKRKAYCHCAMIRDNLDRLPLTFCYYSSVWYRPIWETITGQPVRIESSETLVSGSNICQFAIHLFGE